jgi:signal peptidase I
MMPGDSITDDLLVTNVAGSSNLRYAVSSSATNAHSKGLKDQPILTVKTIDVTTPGTPCDNLDGTQLYAGDLDSTAGKIIGDSAQGAQAGDRTLNSGTNETLCFRVTLPSATPNTYAGSTTTATCRADQEQPMSTMKTKRLIGSVGAAGDTTAALRGRCRPEARESAIEELRLLVSLEEQHRAASACVSLPVGPAAPRPHSSVRRVRTGAPRIKAAIKVTLLTLDILLAAVCMLRFAGYGTLVVHGGSMGNTIPTGSVVLTRPTPSSDIAKGDIILLPNEGGKKTPVIHRVMSVAREGDTIVVDSKGDANRAADPWRSALGPTTQRKLLVIPWLGFALGFLNARLGWIALVILPGGWLCLSVIRRIWSAPTSISLPDVNVAAVQVGACRRAYGAERRHDAVRVPIGALHR